MAEEKPKGWRGWHRREPAKRLPPVQVRFTAESGEVWTVWDTTFSQFKHHRRTHCDPIAKARVFVNAAGVRRSYAFKRGESRLLDPEALERQLHEASYVEPASSRSPT